MLRFVRLVFSFVLMTALAAARAQVTAPQNGVNAVMHAQVRSVLASFDQTSGEFVDALNRKDGKEAAKLAKKLQLLGSIGIITPDGINDEQLHEVGKQFDRITGQYFDAILNGQMPQAEAAVRRVDVLHSTSLGQLGNPSTALTRLGCFKIFMESTYLSERINIEAKAAGWSNFDAYAILRDKTNGGEFAHITASAIYGETVAKALFRFVRPADTQNRALQAWISQTIGYLHEQAKRENRLAPRNVNTVAEFLVYSDLAVLGGHEFRNSSTKKSIAELFALAQDAVRAYAMGQEKLADARRDALEHFPQSIACENMEARGR
jgi:hypothetical protein